MVAGEIVMRAVVVSGQRVPNCLLYPGSHRGRMALSRFEQGRLAVTQIVFRGLRIAGVW
jgi:hypothetical protein